MNALCRSQHGAFWKWVDAAAQVLLVSQLAPLLLTL
jgi:hypothetical protein